MVALLKPSPACTFHGQDERERYQFSTRQHWIRILPSGLKTVASSIVILSFGWFLFFYQGVTDASSRHGLLMVLTILFAIVHWMFFIRFYTYFLYVIVVTDRRIHRIKKTLISVDDHQTIDIWTLQDINKSQHGIVQNIFNYGTVLLESQDTKLRLHFIPNINDVYKKIAHIREVAREHYLPPRVSEWKTPFQHTVKQTHVM